MVAQCSREFSMGIPSNHQNYKEPMDQNLQEPNCLMGMVVMELVVLDFLEDSVVLGQSLVILLELE